MGAALAAIEWVWAYSDSSDPTSEQWNGLTLVVWTGLIALIGFSLWVAGAMVGACHPTTSRPRAGLRTAPGDRRTTSLAWASVRECPLKAFGGNVPRDYERSARPDSPPRRRD